MITTADLDHFTVAIDELVVFLRDRARQGVLLDTDEVVTLIMMAMDDGNTDGEDHRWAMTMAFAVTLQRLVLGG